MKYINEKFINKKVTLLGAGVSNMPLIPLLSSVAAEVTVRDKKTLAELGEAGEIISACGAGLISGDAHMQDLTGDIIFRSPGIRPDIPEIAAAVSRGASLTSEMEEFLDVCPCPVFAVTGSDGKTTTTTITSLLLRAGMSGGEVFLGGNIGQPLFNRAALIKPDDAVAVELSSFQLMTIDAEFEAAAITNITPNHLNWHTSMDEYIDAKKNILKHARRAVLNYDNDITRGIAEEMMKGSVPVTLFSLSPIDISVLRDCDSAIWLDGEDIRTFFPEEGERVILSRSDIKLPGLHNAANYMTAIALTHGRVSAEQIRAVAEQFGGVEHRLEFVRELDGVRYINGSIDSSPTRTAAALSAINGKPITLIAGGYDKNIPYEPLADAIFASSVHALVLTGATADKIYDTVVNHPLCAQKMAEGFKIVKNPSFEGAVRDARECAAEGGYVILSPASASFDCFKNFEERGRVFKDIVNGL